MECACCLSESTRSYDSIIFSASEARLRSVPVSVDHSALVGIERPFSILVATSPSASSAIPAGQVAPVDADSLHRSNSFPDSSHRTLTSAGAATPVPVSCIPLVDLVIWKCPSGLQERLDDKYIDHSSQIGKTLPAALVGVKDFDVLDGSRIRTHSIPAEKALPILSVFQYARNFNNRFNAQRFNLCMCFHGHDFCVIGRGVDYLIAPGAWVRRELHRGCRGAAWCCSCTGCMDSPFVPMGEESRYEFRLSAMIESLQCSIRGGGQAQSIIVPHVELCCLDFQYPWLASVFFALISVPVLTSSID